MTGDLVDPPLNWESAIARIKQLSTQSEELKYKAQRQYDAINDLWGELFTLCLDLDEIAAMTAAPPPWPAGLIHMTGDISGLHCATEGCEGRVSTRFESGGIASDYCEPCGRKVATKGGA